MIAFLAAFLAPGLTTLPARGQSVVTTVPTGTNPGAVAVNAVTNRVYVANTGSNNVTVIDGASNTTTTVTAGRSPNAVAVNAVTNKIYVTNNLDSSVTVIDGATNGTTKISIAAFPGFGASDLPVGVVANPATNKVYAGASSVNGLGTSNVFIIDGATNSVGSVSFPGQVITAMAINTVTNKIYVAGTDDGGGGSLGVLEVIDGATNRTTIVSINNPGSTPSAVGVNSVTNKIYVPDANFNFNNVTVVDGATNSTTTVKAGSNPGALAVNTQTNKIYVANAGSNNLTVIDGTNNNASTVNVGLSPDAVAVDEGTNLIYVLNHDSNNVTVIDGTTNAILEQLAVGTTPDGVAVNPTTHRIYVSNRASNTETVIDGFTGTPAPDFILSAVPTSLTVKLGRSASSTISVTAVGGFSSDVGLSVSGLPSGVTAVFNPESLSAPGAGTSTLTFSASTTAPGGTSTVTVTAGGGGITHSVNIALTVDASPDFFVTVSPASVSMVQGSSASATVTGVVVGGFSGAISLSICCTPTGVTVHLDSIPFPGSGSTTLTFTANSLTAAGTTNLTISATSGGTTHFTPMSLTITAAPPQIVSYTFATATTVGSVRVVTQGTEHLDFTAGAGTTCVPKSYNAGDSCIVAVQFTPRAPGLRMGAVQILDSTGNLTSQTLVSNTGVGSHAMVLPGAMDTAAGNGNQGFAGDNGPANTAELNDPYGVAADAAGNLFIADLYNHRLRRVDATTHTITTLAGVGTSGYSGDGGQASSAELNQPLGVALDGAGNLYIADADNDVVREIDALTGIITTVAGNGFAGFSGDGGPATNAQLFFPFRVTVDGSGNLFITDSSGAIRRVDAATRLITTVAGNGTAGFSGDDGPATAAQLGEPRGVALDAVGNLYIADYTNTRIREVAAATGIITTVAGDGQFENNSIADGGPATNAHLYFPPGVAVDAGGSLYIADSFSHHVRLVSGATGVINTIAGAPNLGQGLGFNGDGIAATFANLAEPDDVAIDSAGNLYVADALNQRIRRISPEAGTMNFPPTKVGSQSATQNVTLVNTGNQDLALQIVISGGGFNLDHNATTCLTSVAPPGGSCTLAIIFAPTSAGQISGSIKFTTDEFSGGSHVVPMSGVGTQ
jgi:YVTN family beta-propeller protein